MDGLNFANAFVITSAGVFGELGRSVLAGLSETRSIVFQLDYMDQHHTGCFNDSLFLVLISTDRGAGR
jgi:hypothetical protein